MKKDTAGKSSIEKTNDKRGTFFNCTKSVKLTDLVCSLCNKLFHKKCVPHQHKMLMSEEEVEDSYVCHKFSVSREFLWHGCGWFWIVNHVTLVSAITVQLGDNNYMCECQWLLFIIFLFNIFLIKFLRKFLKYIFIILHMSLL